MEERLTWNQMVEKYPSKWVAIGEVERVGVQIISGVVLCVCDDDLGEHERILRNRGYANLVWRRTTDDSFIKLVELYESQG